MARLKAYRLFIRFITWLRWLVTGRIPASWIRTRQYETTYDDHPHENDHVIFLEDEAALIGWGDDTLKHFGIPKVAEFSPETGYPRQLIRQLVDRPIMAGMTLWYKGRWYRLAYYYHDGDNHIRDRLTDEDFQEGHTVHFALIEADRVDMNW